MTPAAAIKYFKTQVALAKRLGVTQPCIANWVRRGRIPPAQQSIIAGISDGRLKADRRAIRTVSAK